MLEMWKSPGGLLGIASAGGWALTGRAPSHGNCAHASRAKRRFDSGKSTPNATAV